MQRIELTSAGSICDFDHGEGWVTLCWETPDGLRKTLTIDAAGDSGVEFVSLARDRIVLRFPLVEGDSSHPSTVEYIFDFDEETYRDLERLHEIY